ARVIIAGRSRERAGRCAQELGAAGAAVLDRNAADAGALKAIGADLVIDAAGPFQGADLGFARAVIESGAHYLDLADARDFVAAFPQLDALARRRNVAAVTGASSTPALTHAVLDTLCAGWRRLDIVRAGIAPANKMQRGPSVMKAVLSWTGAPAAVWEEGEWRIRHGWTHCADIDVPGLGRRRFALAETPDLDLIPARYAPRDTALFMAGLEAPLMQRGMEVMSALRRWGLVRESQNWAGWLRGAGELLSAFGSDRGGMIVEAFGRDADDRPMCARWTMIAPNGLGPNTPTFAALILARRFAAGGVLPIGARACVSMLRLEDFAPEFARNGFTTRIDIAPLIAPFETALQGGLDAAPAAVRAAHRSGPVTRWRGAAQVRGASSLPARLIARFFGFPAASPHTPVEVAMRLDRSGVETWTRRFGAYTFTSRLRAVGPGVVRERFGPFAFDIALHAAPDRLAMRVVGWRVGPVSMPARFAPRSVATETEQEGRFHFDVPIALPLLGRIAHYSGWLEPEEVEGSTSPAVLERA
ncbi:MAG: DUF4166 domain-containing protein, partial [Proteobacteria bacterium]|nr:DUF4166 domain-containing protein [Pseudomonadota bacterium]